MTATNSARRLDMLLSETAYRELEAIAEENGVLITEVVRLGIGLVKLAMDAQRNGYRLMTVNADNEAVMEIKMPKKEGAR